MDEVQTLELQEEFELSNGVRNDDQGLDICIEEIETSEEGSKAYTVSSPDSPNGEALVHFYTLAELETFTDTEPITEVHYALLGRGLQPQERGIQPEDKVVELNTFYPTGRRSRRQDMGGVVGSMLLERILNDCKSEGVRALFVSTRNKTMKSFVEKNGFFCFGFFPVGDGYYLML